MEVFKHGFQAAKSYFQFRPGQNILRALKSEFKMFSKFILISIGIAVSSSLQISQDVNDVKFYHYLSANDRREIGFNDASSLRSLASGAPLVILIDGFLSDSTSPMSQNTKNSVLSRAGQGTQNVIVVDWGKLSGAGNTFNNLIETGSAYSTVLKNVGPVGGRVADFINFLQVSRTADPENVHIIGHSLGAHIGGAAGVFYQERYGEILSRISGLDPAGPFFSLQVDSKKRLHKGDAYFVDIYHTNRRNLGDSDHQTGDINVYVNGGDDQPGCEEADKAGFAGFCSHSYSWKLFDVTYHRDIFACACTGLPCQCKNNCNTACSEPIRIGANVPASAQGAYHLIIDDPIY